MNSNSTTKLTPSEINEIFTKAAAGISTPSADNKDIPVPNQTITSTSANETITLLPGEIDPSIYGTLFVPKLVSYQGLKFESPGLVTIQSNHGYWIDHPVKSLKQIKKVCPEFTDAHWSKVKDSDKYIVIVARGIIYASPLI